ncbi:MAG TPA: 50S ribosomal protein L21 [Verrucomicrobiae bacterium]|nr:50S ribosomal protein L21 [Verrucomicrobiae bacterium]
MYAIIQAGGRQYRVQPGERLMVDRMFAEPGSTIQFEDVRLLVPEGGEALVGTPVVAGARVGATVLGHPRGEKIIVFKYKPKKRYRRRMGFRAALTEVRIDSVDGPGVPPAEPVRRSAVPAGVREVGPTAAVEAESLAAAGPAPTAAPAPTAVPAPAAPPARRRPAPEAPSDGA